MQNMIVVLRLAGRCWHLRNGGAGIGLGYVVPIAVGMLIGQGVVVSSILNDVIIVGELALDGRVRPVNGLLSMAMTADANGFSRMIVPLENAKEAAVVTDIEVY